MSVAMVDDSTVPDGFTGGIPYQAGGVAVDSSGAITHHHQGLPFTAQGRIAVEQDAVVDYYGSGAAPFNAEGRLVVTGDAIDSYIAVPFGAGKISVGEPT